MGFAHRTPGYSVRIPRHDAERVIDVGNTRGQARSRTAPSRSWRGQPAPTTGSWGRPQPAANRGGGTAKKGMLMAAAPMIGAFAVKIMRSRKQKKDEATAWSVDRPEVVVVEPPAKV